MAQAATDIDDRDPVERVFDIFRDYLTATGNDPDDVEALAEAREYYAT